MFQHFKKFVLIKILFNEKFLRFILKYFHNNNLYEQIIIKLLKNGKRYVAIKVYQDWQSCSLLSAKEATEVVYISKYYIPTI